ncbi:hypothetical protein D3C87_1113430 [compost metagenome]
MRENPGLVWGRVSEGFSMAPSGAGTAGVPFVRRTPDEGIGEFVELGGVEP